MIMKRKLVSPGILSSRWRVWQSFDGLGGYNALTLYAGTLLADCSTWLDRNWGLKEAQGIEIERNLLVSNIDTVLP